MITVEVTTNKTIRKAPSSHLLVAKGMGSKYRSSGNYGPSKRLEVFDATIIEMFALEDDAYTESIATTC